MRHPVHALRRKLSFRLLATFASLGAITSARAFVATGPDDELFATGVASAQANDNLFLSHNNQKSDGVFDLVPGLEFDYGKNSLAKGLLSIDEDFQLFGSDSNLDTELTNAVFNLAYSDDKTKLNLDATFHQADQATRDVHQVGSLVKRDLYHADATGEVSLTDKSSVGGGVVYDDTDYLRTGYTDWQWVKIPVKYYYEVEPKVDLSAGFTFQNNQLGTGGINSDEYFYNVGARGEFTPKLTGQLNVGYAQLEPDRGGSRGGFGVDSSFTYAYSPKTSFTFGANNDFGYSAVLGQVYRLFGLSGSVNTTLSDQWKANAQFSYGNYDYLTTIQKDNFYNGEVGLTYVFSTNISLTGSYNYIEDSSNITLDSFTDNLFTLSVSFRY
jgi:polysaccharide biosynthesis protein VpsM